VLVLVQVVFWVEGEDLLVVEEGVIDYHPLGPQDTNQMITPIL